MSSQTSGSAAERKLTVTFRGTRLEYMLREKQNNVSSLDVKWDIIHSESADLNLIPSDLKLLYKGKAIDIDSEDLLKVVQSRGKMVPKIIKMIAMGRSSTEVQEIAQDHEAALESAPRIRDDLTDKGRQEVEERRRMGMRMLLEAAKKTSPREASSLEKYGFGTIETLHNLPNEERAREILTQLSKDPGILACMKKHGWRVGSLAELYPEGKVGESAVCVMGLNQNKGQKILLRVRTDDMRGFRKMLSIRKVLFHELAHNVHSDHGSGFFQLMRQIERECNDMDWTGGSRTSGECGEGLEDVPTYSGGIYRLGGGNEEGGVADAFGEPSKRELRARAALSRMTVEEVEVERCCGCGLENPSLFLPKAMIPDGNGQEKERGTDGNCCNGHEGTDMDALS